MRTETRSKDSDRKWVLFVLCGTRCFIKPVYVRDIVLHGSWAAGKHIHKYRDTTWRDNKSYVIMLLLTGSAPQTKKKKLKPDRTQRGMHQCRNTYVHSSSFQQTFSSHSVSYFVSPKTKKWERGPCSEPASLELPILEDVTHETQAYSEGVKYSDTQGVKTGKTQ